MIFRFLSPFIFGGCVANHPRFRSPDKTSGLSDAGVSGSLFHFFPQKSPSGTK